MSDRSEDDTRPVKADAINALAEAAKKPEVAYTFTEVDEEMAKLAYEAYVARMRELGFGPPPTHTQVVPTWDEQEPWLRECWRTAVRAAIRAPKYTYALSPQ